MFPTAGYFRGTNCPFFVHGLCHRPYCHFRHSKPGLKTSKKKPSTHKSSKEEFSSFNNTKTTVTQDLDSTTKVVHSETGKEGLPKDAKTSTQLRGILKRSTSEEEESKVHVQSSNKDNSTLKDLYHNKSQDGTKESLIVNTESLELDDYEQPVPSLTDEEKLIIGLPTIKQRKDRVHETCLENLNGSLQKTSDIDACHAKTDSSMSMENKQIEQDSGSDSHAGNFASDVVIVKEDVKIVSEGTCKETVVDENDTKKQTENGATVGHVDITGSMNKDAVEISNQTSSMKRKSIHLEVSNEVHTEMESVTTDLVGNATKRRKSQLLPCDMSVDNLSQAVELSPKDNCFKEIVVNKQAAKLKSQCDSNFLRKIRESGMLLFDGNEKCKSKTVCSLTNSKPDFGSVKITGSKALTKEPSLKKLDVLQKKAKISDSGIDFFGCNIKLTKQNKIEKRKADEGVSPSSRNSEIKRSSPAKGKEHTKKPKKAMKPEPTYITIESSEESNACSPAFSDSSPEDEDQLKRIWNDFEPQEVSIDEDVKRKSPVKKQKQVELPKKNALSYPASEKLDIKKPPLLADTLGLGKKQRVAHAANHLPRRLSSNANPVRRYPKTLAAVAAKEPSIAGTSLGSSISEAYSSSQASRKRIAHVPKNVTPAGSVPRPKIPLEYGAKVPQNQRQRYLDRIVDEYLRLCPSEKVAYEKAVEEEKALYERSSRRQVYLNLCVNAIKKLRGMASMEIQEAKNNAVVKTLPSGAVVVSTKSPVPKQQRVPQSVPNELTEEILYNCLSNYLLSEDDLVENGYPRPCPNSPGRAVFKSRKQQPTKDSTKRTCCRCGKPFVVLEDGEYLTKEECVYHSGKLFRRRGEPITNYSCCQGDAGSPGCCVGKAHVSDTVCDTDGFMTTIVSPIRENNHKVFALDCEMCYTTAGLELTRITVVNWNLERVYDSFVMPGRRIVDYNTRFSGVTEESLRGVTTTIREIQAVLLSMIHRDTILVGHSLESDLKAIKLIHSKAVDTSVVFPHRLGPPYKRALRNLMAENLNKIIQDGVDGHDSHEDASACLELMRWRVKEDIKKSARAKGPLYTKRR